ncbi:MAG: hypothetical protein R3E66_02895 [bacterium]
MLYVTSDEYGYFETIQAFFLEMTGKGLVLSSRDVEALIKWRDEGATAATICKGIERAIEARAEKPRDIWACRKWIEPLVAVARSHAAGSHDPDDAVDESPQTRVLDSIEAAGRAAQRDAFKQAYRQAWAQIRATEEVALWEALLEADRALVAAFLLALSDEERKTMQDQILADPSLRSMSAAAKESHIEARTKKALKAHYGLVSPLDV